MRKDIQDYIIECQLLDMTLKDIVDGIEEKFSVHMTKQNVSKFYSRYLQRSAKITADNYLAKTCVEVYIRSRYIRQCIESELLKGVTEYKLKRHVDNNELLMEEKKRELEEKIIKLYSEGYSIEDIAEETKYKDLKTDLRVIFNVIDGNIINTGIDRKSLMAQE